MNDSLKWWIGLHGFVESPFLSNVFYNGKVKLVLGDVGVGIPNRLSFGLGADRCDNGVALI